MGWNDRPLWPLFALATLGCNADPFECQSDAQCVAMNGEVGECFGGACAFPDGRCASGLRFGAHAAAGLAGECVPVENEAPTATSSATPPTTTAISTTAGTETRASSSGPPGSDATSTAAQTEVGGVGTGPDPTTGGNGEPGLVAWYACDDLDNGVVADQSGNGHDATCTSCPTLEPGPVDNACRFENGQRLLVADHPDFHNDEFTIALWVRRSVDPPGNSMAITKILGDENGSTFDMLSVGQADMTVDMFFCYGNLKSQPCARVREFAIDSFVHFAAVFDGASGVIYLDGEAEEIGPLAEGGLGYDEGPFIIGGDFDNGKENNPLMGSVDDVRIYSRALNAAEIAALIAG